MYLVYLSCRTNTHCLMIIFSVEFGQLDAGILITDALSHDNQQWWELIKQYRLDLSEINANDNKGLVMK